MTKLKDEIQKILHPENKMLEISLNRLHPPMAPRPIVSETSVIPEASGSMADSLQGFESLENGTGKQLTDSTLAIDFDKIANSSEFQRFIYYLLTGRTHRGNERSLKMKVKKVSKDLEFVNRFGDVMKEFKQKVKVLKKRESS